MSERDSEVLRLDGVWKSHRRWKKRPQHLKEALIGALKGRRAEYDEFWPWQGLADARQTDMKPEIFFWVFGVLRARWHAATHCPSKVGSGARIVG